MIEGVMRRDLLETVLQMTSAGCCESLQDAFGRTVTEEELAEIFHAPVEHIHIKVQGCLERGYLQIDALNGLMLSEKGLRYLEDPRPIE